MTTPLANILQPLTDVEEWVLEKLHSLGLEWGLAIVGLTLLTRLVMLPLIVRQFRSQREMKLHMPELARMKERYKGGDKQELQREMAAYYKAHGINPLASIGPLLLQVPVFISLYMLLRQDATNGLFGDGGFLFIPDLTAKPQGAALVGMLAIYLTSQLASSAIATRTLQKSHRGIAMALPLLFAGVIVRFPAGLAVYSITTSLWSLGQQIAFWRLSPAVPAGTAALAAEVEDVLDAGEDSKLEQAPEREAVGVGAGAASNGSGRVSGATASGRANGAAAAASGGGANGAGATKAVPQHSRSKKKKRSRSRR